MNTATELRKGLETLGVLDAAAIESLVSKAIAENTVVDDTVATELDPSMVKSLVAEMTSALNAASEPPSEDIAKADTQAKVDEDGDYVDIVETLTSVVGAINGVNSVVKSLAADLYRKQAETNKGLMAIGKLVEAFVGQSANIGKSQAAILESQTLISQHLKMPTPPRAKTGAAVIPHPGDVAKSGVDGNVIGINAAVVDKRALMAKAQGEIHKLSSSTDPTAHNQIQALASAVSALESGCSVDEVRASFPVFSALVA